MLGVSVPTLYEMRRSGASLPPRIRIGKHDRYRVEDIQAWLDSQYLDVPTRPQGAGGGEGLPVGAARAAARERHDAAHGAHGAVDAVDEQRRRPSGSTAA